MCTCGEEEELIVHIIMNYNIYKKQRKKLLDKLYSDKNIVKPFGVVL